MCVEGNGPLGRRELSLSGWPMPGAVCKKSEHLRWGPSEGWG